MMQLIVRWIFPRIHELKNSSYFSDPIKTQNADTVRKLDWTEHLEEEKWYKWEFPSNFYKITERKQSVSDVRHK